MTLGETVIAIATFIAPVAGVIIAKEYSGIKRRIGKVWADLVLSAPLLLQAAAYVATLAVIWANPAPLDRLDVVLAAGSTAVFSLSIVMWFFTKLLAVVSMLVPLVQHPPQP